MVEVWKILAQTKASAVPCMLTLYHVLHSLYVIFTKVDNSSLCFSESVAAGSREKG
jgi:hypothetical protein